MMNNKIRVLIVDDSAVVRQTLTSIISDDPELEVMGTAGDPFQASEKIQKEVPDVITLDVEMPRMDGLSFLKKIMSQHPIPVVICSSLTVEGSDTLYKAIQYGAIEIITKPKMGTRIFLEESKIKICDCIKAAAKADLKKLSFMHSESRPKYSADAVIAKPKTILTETTEKIIALGASTGGTEAIRFFLEQLPLDIPGMVIVQHMPETFTASFAKRLNEICDVTIKEASNNDTVLRGHVLIAPGNKHMLLKRSGARYYVEITEGPLVNRHRPAVDVLFRSTARYAGKNAMGIILTGMGDDGAKGMKEMFDAGAFTVAQDADSCVVFGMPKEAIEAGGVSKILPLDKIASEVTRFSKL
ncbi:MAG TPA: chemotaxis response regulator protein-glutamate methylesterase [Chitinispirillaceae bacterium]|nr:chemotaxis response regulator protein-glutamate methylesterase [Chitinispirillaceae bacterium]